MIRSKISMIIIEQNDHKRKKGIPFLLFVN